jgi:hypothetical protein
MRTSIRTHVVRSTLAAVLLASAVGSCGKAADEEPLQIDSNTNWWMRCDSDEQCSGSLRCFCGQCSQPCSESDECSQLAGAECASSGGAACVDRPSAGGLCVLTCSDDASCGPDFTCTESQCVPKACTGGFQSWDDVYRLVAANVAQLDADDARFARYISLANRWAYGPCGPTLAAEREGLSKLLNSLSIDTTITAPVPIDVDLTLYRINLNDYDWNQPIDVMGTAYPDVWEALVAQNPLAVPFIGDDADDAVADTGARVPVMFANSFIATATRPELYYAILGIPDSYAALLDDLGVDATAPAERAGYVDGPEIVATYHRLGNRNGYLWNLGAVDTLAPSLFVDPLQTPTGERQLIFTLGNGLQAFAYTDAAGLRIDDSPTFIDASENNFRAVVPRTPLRQHSPKPNVRDEVRTYLANNPDVFSQAVETTLVGLYRDDVTINAIIESDYQSLTRPALEAAGVDERRPEPISTAYAEYERDMALEDAAGDLMVTREDLEANLSLLDPAMSVLDLGRIDRDDFIVFYRESLCLLSVVNENTPAPEWCL